MNTKTKYHKLLKMRYPFICITCLTLLAKVFNWDIYWQLGLALTLSSLILTIHEISRQISFFKENPLKNFHAFFIRKRLVSCIIYFLILSISLTATLVLFLKFAGDELSELAMYSGFVFLALLFCTPSFVSDLNYVAIYPYFEKKVGNIETYASGTSIARRIKLLDNIAQKANLPTISSFGYKDSWKNKELTWYDTNKLLPTTKTLIDLIENKPDIIDDSDNIKNELEKIHTALTKANEQNINFCLVMDCNGCTNQMEHEQRDGAFF